MGNSDLSQCWQSMCYHDLFIPWFILSSLCQYAIMGCSYYSLRLHNMGCSDSSLCQCVIITLIKKERKIQISFENKCDRCELFMYCMSNAVSPLSTHFPLQSSAGYSRSSVLASHACCRGSSSKTGSVCVSEYAQSGGFRGDEHATAPDLCHPPWCHFLPGQRQRKVQGQTGRAKDHGLLVGCFLEWDTVWYDMLFGRMTHFLKQTNGKIHCGPHLVMF